MKKYFIFLTVQFFVLQSAFGQVKAYFTHSGNFFAHENLVVDGKEIKPTGVRYEIADSMKSNPKAAELADLHQKSATNGNIALWTGAGLAVGYLFSTPYDHVNYGTYWGIFGVGFFTAIYFHQKARHYLYESVNTYNGVPLSSNTSFDLQFGGFDRAKGLLTIRF